MLQLGLCFLSLERQHEKKAATGTSGWTLALKSG